MFKRLRQLCSRRPKSAQGEFGIWEAKQNVFTNGGFATDLSGWQELRIPGKALFGDSGERSLTIQPGLTTVQIGRTGPAAVLDEAELRRAAREYVERGATFSPTVLRGDDIVRFFAFCDELRGQGHTVGVLTEPVRAGWRRLAEGTECEMVASWTDGRALLKHGRYEFYVDHDQHYLRWRWDDEER